MENIGSLPRVKSQCPRCGSHAVIRAIHERPRLEAMIVSFPRLVEIVCVCGRARKPSPGDCRIAEE